MKRLRPIAYAILLLAASIACADEAERSIDNDRVLAWFLEMPASVDDVLVALTDSASMHRYSRAGVELTAKDQRYMSIGTNGAGKQRAWDKKTPLGVYFITERLDTSKLHDKYGVAAFPLDYPNAWDLHNQRTGSGIWLHGVDHKNPQRPPLDTDGCLAIPNEEILAIADELVPLVTPVVVARGMRWASKSQLEMARQAFRAALDQWRQSLENGDVVNYLNSYAEDFNYHGMDKSEWGAWRRDTFEANPLQSVRLSELMLMADPEVEDLYLSRFTQVLETENGPVTTIKRLYWKRTQGNIWKIVSEGNG